MHPILKSVSSNFEKLIMEIAVSLVTYNTSLEDFENVCRSVLSTSLDIKLFVVDNSPKDTLRSYCNNERIEYIFNPSNPGFGAAHNIAIKKAINEKAKYHLVINPDVYYTNNSLETIVNYMDNNPEVGNLMPRVEYPDGSIQYLCKLLPTPYDWIGRRFNPIKSMVDKRNELFELRFTNYNQTMEVPYLSGCFMFLRVSALENVGLFDDGIFMYGEETDLCRRLISSGYKTVFFHEVTIVHHFEKGSHKSLKLTLIGMKSALYYFNKWGWFFDKERKKINKNILDKLGYKTK